MSLINIGYEQAHEVVGRSHNLFWDGWDIVEWKKNPDAIYDKNGMFVNGYWGNHTRFSPSDLGWRVPKRYV